MRGGSGSRVKAEQSFMFSGIGLKLSPYLANSMELMNSLTPIQPDKWP